jgi:hypothetical protein
MEGFESVADESDLTARGWLTSTATNVSGNTVLGLPSRTGMNGRGLMLRGPYTLSTSPPMQGTGGTDFGMINCGKSVYSLWQSGGFAVGVAATFNSTTSLQIASIGAEQFAFDGQYYWAIANKAGTYCVAYSSDLINWTVTQASPSGLSQYSTITVMVSGSTTTVIVSHIAGSYSVFIYTSNMGLSWTSSANAGATINGQVLQPVITGNSATPLVAVGLNASTGAISVIYYTAINAPPARVGTIQLGVTNTTYNFDYGTSCLAGGYAFLSALNTGTTSINAPSSSVVTWVCCPVTADMTVPANWVSTNVPGGQQMAVVFFNNQWISVGYGGIHTTPNTSTLPLISYPGAFWQTALNTGTVPVWAIACNNSVCVAVGQDPVAPNTPAIWTSTDGNNWVKQNRFIGSTTVNASLNTNSFNNVIWDGKQFVVVGGGNNNVIATSPDGFSWTPLYYPDYNEVAAATSGSQLGLYGGVQTGTGYSAYQSGTGKGMGVGLVPGPVSGTTRSLSLAWIGWNGTATTITTGGTAQNVPINPLTHYYEIIGTSDPNTVNVFVIQMAIDGVICPGSMSIALGLSTDTAGTSQLLLNLPRAGNWTMIDDIYFTDFNDDLAGNVGQLGIVSIVPHMPTTDVQAQMTQVGSAANHAVQVAGALSSSSGGVGAFTQNAKDIYSSNQPVPSNYRVQAIQAEAFFSKYGIVGGNAAMGVISGQTEVDALAVSAITSTPVYTSMMLELDPNTNQPWTIAAAQALKLAVTKKT